MGTDISDFHHISLFGEMLLMDILANGLPVSSTKQKELIQIVESSLKQVIYKQTGSYESKVITELSEIAANMYLNLVKGSEYLLFSIIPPSRYLELSLSPSAFFGLHQEDLKSLAKERFTKFCLSEKNVSCFAKGFVSMVIKALKIAEHQNFKIE